MRGIRNIVIERVIKVLDLLFLSLSLSLSLSFFIQREMDVAPQLTTKRLSNP